MSATFQERMSFQIKEVFGQFNLDGTIEYLAVREGVDYFSLDRHDRKNELFLNYRRWLAAETFNDRHPELVVV